MREKFRVSSGLKNLIGSELITDNYIAVFELVKNSFDAQAKKVIVRFENIYSTEAKIIIIDNGKGMDYDDLKNKWLFVAYSAKKDGTEDKLDKGDYRDNLKNRSYAGNKGVGRFSCDRLGSKLNLYTLKDAPKAEIQKLYINWEDFEKNPKEDFINIKVDHQVLPRFNYTIKHGTVVEISGIKNKEWDRTSLLLLKDKLTKLIRPDLNNIKEKNDFTIILDVPDEKQSDQDYIKLCKKEDKEPQDREIVNGEIKNFIFDTLDIKTTKIISEIIEDESHGSLIQTTLIDRDIKIYEVREKNTYPNLRDVSIHLYFLNKAAKRAFTIKMGIEPVNYGNLFLYKNGFRVHPFGDSRTDPFGIDAKATQQHGTNVALRNLIGQIDIGHNPELRETTSRDGGLIKNNAFIELQEYLFKKVLNRLQKYVIDVSEWGVNDETLENLTGAAYKRNLVKLISNITSDKGLISIWYNQDIIRLVETKEEASAKKLIKNFKRIASETQNPGLLKEAKKLEKRLETLQEAKNTAEKVVDKLAGEKAKIEQELQEQVTESLFTKAILGTDTKEVIGLQHQIDRSTDRIQRRLTDLIEGINIKAPKEVLLSLVEKISLENKKIATIAQYVTKANFNLKNTEIEEDLAAYIKEYIDNVYKESGLFKHNNKRLNVQVRNNSRAFKRSFKPLEVIIVLDNLFSNSIKAGAKNILVSLENTGPSSLTLKFKDDGEGITDDNVTRVFTLMFSTTRHKGGSGIGLFQTKQIVEKMRGEISVNNKTNKGVEFIIKFKK